MRARVLVEMLNPIDTNTVISPARIGKINRPIRRERAVAIPAFEVHFPCNNYVRRNGIAARLHSLDNCNPFPITRLDLLRPPATIRRSNNEGRRDLAHQKPSLVEIPD